MLDIFYPKERVGSVYDIPWEDWYRRGIRGVIFDIDNTLVPHDAPADERAMKLFAKFREMGMKTCLLSNNREPRVAAFAEKVGGTDYIYKARKPAPGNYYKAMERMGTTAQTTLFVGDQLFTDVWGANLAGIYGILVKPIDPKEEIQIILKRYPEKLVLYFYEKRGKRR
jgi:HAD superfamily phosphatase (TIGR01668 family)